MLEDMLAREQTLLVPMFLGAVLLDPFNSFEITDGFHLEAATVYIVKLVRQILNFNNPESCLLQDDPEPGFEPLDGADLGEGADDYAAVLRRRRLSGNQGAAPIQPQV